MEYNMNIEIPYMPSVKNLHQILDKMQKASSPEAFGYDFLKDLGFTSSNDRAIIKILKYLDFLDSSGRPQDSYRDFMNDKISKKVLGKRLTIAFDDLFKSNKEAYKMTVDDLKGWFKTKTGKGDSVATKIATTFKALADYADFKNIDDIKKDPEIKKEISKETERESVNDKKSEIELKNQIGLVYRFEIHLPDTQNIDTYRAIFKAMKEELFQ